MGGIVKKAKKVVKKVTKVVKKVVKGIGKVAKKVWKGVKGAVKKIGKVVKKMGPLASIAIGFIPGFQGLWANAGIWGAMGKGAITGFITSGGKLKGALLGAAGGGIGYGLNAGIDAYQKGVAGLGENATISEKITAGFKSVGNSTMDGVSNMYKSANNLVTGGGGGLDYLKMDARTGEMVSLYDQKAGEFARMDGTSVLHGANDSYIKSLDPKAQEFISSNQESFRDLTPKQINQIFENQQGITQVDKLTGYKADVATEKLLAEQGGYAYEKYADTYLTPSADEYQSAISNRALDAQSFYDKLTGEPIKASMQDVNYRGPLGYVEIDADTGKETVYKAGTKSANLNRPSKNLGDSLASSLLGNSSGAGGSLNLAGFGQDSGDQYDATGGLLAMSGGTGTGLDFAESYGGALAGSAYAEQAAQKARQRYNIG